MKITSITALLCLSATALAVNVNRPSYDNVYTNSLAKRGDLTVNQPRLVARHDHHNKEHDHEGHKDDDNSEDDDDEDKESKDGDEKKKKVSDKKSKIAKTSSGDKVGEDGDDKKSGGEDKVTDKDDLDASKKDDNDEKAPAAGADDGNGSSKKEMASPLWVVQPIAASVWEQDRAYAISWGPNPDPAFAKMIAPKSSVDIRLMRGTPETLNEVAVLKTGVDSSAHSFEWTVPATLPVGKDYTIRILQDGKVDTYSHYFEIVKAGDPRSSKSNVGEPLELPKKGDVPHPLNKGPTMKPAAPSNPLPANNPATKNPVNDGNTAAKPKVSVSAASETRNANVLAFAMTLFGAVYFL
ncbi:hypothetical protein BG011_001203 [Mortierella polycephala]|uniref:Yeast cell wall synthesis Kre9/Knh1-like N-terminal domain-containing protein n=1 Tax=Mortierella polycephala TaxID=41804 RepID=A0A9P6UAN8_9FUNG|nr:hypothetical protein BG011_001203 [Mortierella polycephala]